MGKVRRANSILKPFTERIDDRLYKPSEFESESINIVDDG
jgi:hypothetical protein